MPCGISIVVTVRQAMMSPMASAAFVFGSQRRMGATSREKGGGGDAFSPGSASSESRKSDTRRALLCIDESTPSRLHFTSA